MSEARKIIGYVVCFCDPDGLKYPQGIYMPKEGAPKPGILGCADSAEVGSVTVFPDRKTARAAIMRTHHHNKLWYPGGADEAKDFRIVAARCT